jgi:hypothetical protein
MSDRRRRDAPVLGNRREIAADRRAAPRYPTRGTAAVIGWAEGEEYCTIAATLLDISLGGFSASVEAFPPRGEAVWLRIEGDNSPSPWVRASVIEANTTGCLFWTRKRIRLRFVESCPYEFFKAAIEGFTRQVGDADEPTEGFTRRDWR